MSTSPRISAQAGAWISRLNADDRTAAVDAACQEWLNADPRHRAAFEVANRMWEDASTLPVSLSARIGRSARKFPTLLSLLRGKKAQSRHRDLSLAELAPLSRENPRNWQMRWLAAAGVALAVFAGALLYVQRPQVLETKTGQQLAVPLEDGSRLILNTDTRARVRFDKHARRIELDAGEALFDVAKDSARPFIVRAGDREITALGTRFVVRYDETQTAVTLMDGKVSVSGEVTLGEEPHPPAVAERGTFTPDPSPGDGREEPSVRAKKSVDAAQMTVLEPGERVTFVQNTRLAKIDRPVIEAVTAWRKGEIIFESTPLSTAIEEMNRYSVRKLKLAAGAPAHMPVSGLFRSGDAESFALALTTTHPLEAMEHGGEIEIRAR